MKWSLVTKSDVVRVTSSIRATENTNFLEELFVNYNQGNTKTE